MGRRTNGNRYERKMWHRRKNRALSTSYGKAQGAKRRRMKRLRQEARRKIHNGLLANSFDVFSTPDKDWWTGSGGGYPMNWSYNHKCPELTAEEIKRLPGVARHRWIDHRIDNERNAQLGLWQSRRYYYDYEKVLKVLKAIYFTDKMKYLKQEIKVEVSFSFIDSSGKINDTFMRPWEPPEYTLLDQWWRSLHVQTDMEFNTKSKVSQHELALKLLDLGYDCFTSRDRKTRLPLDAR